MDDDAVRLLMAEARRGIAHLCDQGAAPKGEYWLGTYNSAWRLGRKSQCREFRAWAARFILCDVTLEYRDRHFWGELGLWMMLAGLSEARLFRVAERLDNKPGWETLVETL